MRPDGERIPRWLGLAALLLVVISGAVRAQNPPLLRVEPVPPDAVRLAWDLSDPDWVLEGAPALLEWETVLTAPAVDGSEIALLVPQEFSGSGFYWRLRSQETSGVPGGRNFLRDSNGDAGIWEILAGRSILETSTALEALASLRGSDPELNSLYNDGLTALQGMAPRNNDELARTILALLSGGVDVTSMVDELLDAQNPVLLLSTETGYPGSGWGLATGYADSTLDTALALRAVKAAGYPTGLSVVDQALATGETSAPIAFDVPAGSTGMFLLVRALDGAATFRFTLPGGSPFPVGAPGGAVTIGLGTPAAGSWSLEVENTSGAANTFTAEVSFTTADSFDIGRLTAATTYLGTTRNLDGGWGLGPGQDSHLMATCEVMRTLAACGTPFEAIVNAGGSWLTSNKQNADNGFSSEADNSNSLETALAVIALRASTSGGPVGAAQTFLESQQLLNGSWNDDPYVTAMALLALIQPPVVSPIPGESVVDPATFATINLDDFVADPDHADSEITWTVTGDVQLAVSIVNRVATITYPPATEATETLTFTATDPDGLADSASAVFTVASTPPVDHTIALGGSTTGMRSFSTTVANFGQVFSLTENQSGVPAGVTYTFQGASPIAPDTFEVNYQISVAAGAAVGIHSFTVEYGLIDASFAPLLPVFDNVFDFTIEITP